MRKKADILGIPIDNVTMEEAMAAVKKFLNEDKVHAIYTPNSEIMMAALQDNSLKETLKAGDLLVPDGAGVVLASKILGNELSERVPGFDLVNNIFKMSPEMKPSFFLLGAKPGVAEEAAVNIINRFPDVKIAGWHHGYFSENEENEIIEKINSSGADILLVALGAPKQEKWIHKNKGRFHKVKICIGIGGSLDVFAGKANLAPPFFREHSLEWLYGLYKEPRRFRRMLKIPRFLLIALYSRLSGKKYN